MADSIKFHFDTSDIKAEFARINKSSDRATMWALRQGGRQVKTLARRGAPRYAGPPRNVTVNGQSQPIKRGELRASISSGKRLSGGTGAYSLKVAARGDHVKLYAAKQEARRPFMAPAVSAVVGLMPSIAEGAWTRAITRK